MTLCERGPYLRRAIRTLVAITGCVTLSACATDVVSRAEHAEVLSSLRALRSENARLEARLEKLEAARLLGATASVARLPQPIKPSKPDLASDAMPPLAVVKLKPKRESAPALDTTVAVEEPAEAEAPMVYTDASVANLDAQSPESNEPPKNASDQEVESSLAEAQFERGLSLMKTGNSSTGATQMIQFVTDWPRHPKADNALYLAGTASMADQNFTRAVGLFERVVGQYPAGDAVIDAMLKLAECNARLNRPREARATWEKIVANYPGTPAATQAQARLASLHLAAQASP